MSEVKNQIFEIDRDDARLFIALARRMTSSPAHGIALLVSCLVELALINDVSRDDLAGLVSSMIQAARAETIHAAPEEVQ